MLVHRSDEEREAIRNKYIECHGADLIVDLRSNCSGDYEDALVACIAPKTRTLARGIRKCMSGWLSSTNKTGLMALLTHKDQRMPQLRKQFEKEFSGKTLQGVIKKECRRFRSRPSLSRRYTPPGASNLSAPTTKFPVLRSSRSRTGVRRPAAALGIPGRRRGAAAAARRLVVRRAPRAFSAAAAVDRRARVKP